jgi:hypothetical protein
LLLEYACAAAQPLRQLLVILTRASEGSFQDPLARLKDLVVSCGADCTCRSARRDMAVIFCLPACLQAATAGLADAADLGCGLAGKVTPTLELGSGIVPSSWEWVLAQPEAARSGYLEKR